MHITYAYYMRITTIIFDFDGTIAVTWGFPAKELLYRARPDALVDTIDELEKVLRRSNMV